MKPDVKKIIADIKATKGNRKYCNGLAGTLQDDNYVSSICKYVKTVTPERIDLLIDYVENLEVKVLDMAVQLANAESKCRELAGVVAENADLKSLIEQHAGSIAVCPNCSHEEPSETDDIVALYRSLKTPATDAFQAEVRAQGVEMYADTLDRGADDAERDGFDDGVKFLRAEAEGVREFAAQLRKGGAA
ncbi:MULTISPECIES: hypothetical protein [Citrobacter]|uniref:Ead/Ea22-like family protein n=1 Tax=Citrobacter pasteurii TaxID=1563222 RepID=A0ABX8K121_9ENTR|nr:MULTISPECIES: hypothetical protein [Citrobacter]QXA42832.1 hypothetical protein I6L54_12505 [Citrobacter pasteurii]TKU53662.1 hypothetical protein FDX05_21160 [Citrobacter sp. wls715]CEJ64100.1 Phage eae protein [Citrobacter pasteurii]